MNIFLHNFFKKTVIIFIVFVCTGLSLSAQHELIAGWHFNSFDASNRVIVADDGSGTLYLNGDYGSADWPSGSVSRFTGTTDNLEGLSDSEDVWAFAAVGANSNNKYMTFKFSMTDKENLRISFSRRGTSTGHSGSTWQYSIDGSSWSNITGAGNSSTRNTTFSTYTINTNLLDNADSAFVRVRLTGATGIGNNRIDNFKLEAENAVPLTISLGAVNAYNSGDYNTIQWEALSEEAGDKYVVEKSDNGKVFSDLYSVSATGQSPKTYQFEDHKPVSGINFYRIRLENNDGSVNYSKTVTVNRSISDDNTHSIEIYPNPVQTTLTIRVSEIQNATKAIITVTDYTGRQILQEPVHQEGEHLINMEDFESGVYIIHVTDGTNSSTRKIVKL